MSRISVVIPTYNHGPELVRVLNGLFGQTHAPDEIIVVDDGSTDDTPQLIAPFLHSVRYIRQENKGASAARNRGAHEAHGEYIVFCDADLIVKEYMLEKMYNALERDHAAAFAYSSFMFGWKAFPLFDFSLRALQRMPYIHSTSLLRAQWFPGFDESLKKFQDWDVFLTIAQKGGRGVWINEYLFTVTPREKGMSKWFPSFLLRVPGSSLFKRVREYKEAYEIIRRKHHLH